MSCSSRQYLRPVPLFIFAAMVFCCAYIVEAKTRVWTDKSGKFKIEAEFIEVKDGNVQFKKSNGEVISVPLTKLSKDDQVVLRKIAQKRREAEKSQPNSEERSIEDEFRDRIRQGGSFQMSREVVSEGGTRTESFSVNFGDGDETENLVPRSRRHEVPSHDGFWTDVTGRHKIKAKFLSLENDEVSLRRTDGKVIKLPLAKLSATDQKRARTIATSSVNLASSANPFGDGSLDDSQTEAIAKRQRGEFYRGDIVEVQDFHDDWKRGVVVKVEHKTMSVLYDGESRTDTIWLDNDMDEVRLLKANPNGANYSTGGTKLSKTDLSGARTISFEHSPTGTFVPDAEIVVSGESPRGFTLQFQGLSVFQDFVCVAPLPDVHQLFAAIGDDHPGAGTNENSVLCFYDVNAGKLANQHRLEKIISTAAVSPLGKRIATTEDGDDPDDSKTLDVWDMTSGVLERQASWDPHRKEFFHGIKSVAWIDEQRLITTNFNNLLIWDADSRKLLYKIEDAGDRRFTLSHNRKQLFVASRDAILAIDLDSGDILQKVEPKETRHYGLLAVCPSGQLLAASHSLGTQIDLINLETGEIFDTLNLHSKANEDIGFFWPDDQHILIGGKDLVHVASKTTVWNYQHQASKIVYSNGRCWFLLRGNNPQEKYLLPLRLPQSEVAKVDKSHLALQPGDVVSLEIQLAFDMGGGDKSIFEETRVKLTKDLEEAGFYVSEGAPAVLTAKTEQGETNRIQYRRFGDFRGEGEIMNVTPRVYSLELRVGEEIVWQRRQVQSPSFHLNLEKNESIQDAINRVMQPSAGYFGIGIPSRFLKPSAAESRYSQVTHSGLE